MLERYVISVGTMSAQVELSLGMRVVSGEFRPGDSLPIESELCETYGVSRTTIREAVKRLAAKRLVDVSPKIGTRVLPFADWNLLDRDVLTWRLNAQFDRKIVEDIFEMRLCFEPRASFLAARDGTVKDHDQIVRHCNDLAAAYASNSEDRDVSEAALEFHLAVINASQNGMFLTIGSAIKSVLRASSEMLQKQAARPSEDVELHENIASAIVSRKPREASRAMEQLLIASRERVLPLTIRATVIDPVASGVMPAARSAPRKGRLRSAP
jgi:GntR family galactonate operon transcriptional repressor